MASSNATLLDVVVCGAGCAGLYAAYLLAQRGLRVKVVEAAGLVGGRAYNRRGLFAWPVDLGGEFIHGELTHFKALCAELGLSTVRTFSSFPPTPYFEDGRPVAEWLWFGQEAKLVSWDEAQRTDKDFAHALDVMRAMEEARDVQPGENLYKYLVRHGVKQRMLSMSDAVYAKTWAADLSDLSVRGCIHEGGKPDTGRDNYILENSTGDLIQALAKRLDIVLNQEVVAVTQQGDVCTVDTKEGASYKTKRVVVAVPITSVPSIRFSPALPAPFLAALSGAGVGVAVKTIIRFSRRFWPEHVLLCFCSDSPVPQLWMDPPRPSYGSKETGHAVTCFVTGTPAVAMAKQPAWKVVQQCLLQLDDMFGTKEDKRPATSSYEDHVICKWDTVAYTYPSGITPEVLCGPVANGTVCFAGEHCGTAASEIATINGALESARVAADYVTTSLGKKQNKL